MLEYLDVIVQKARLQQAILPRYLINNRFSESELKVCFLSNQTQKPKCICITKGRKCTGSEKGRSEILVKNAQNK